jgi:multiphosphoryl transfer protein
MTLRVRLPEALHARPATRLVRLAQRFTATVTITRGTKQAQASKILEVLALGAASGDEIELAASGDDAEEALAALHDLVVRGFLADLVPETGAVAVEGIAIGHAFLVGVVGKDDAGAPGDPAARTVLAFAQAKASLATLIASLPPREAALFEPEVQILDDLEPTVLARVAAGDTPGAAIATATEIAPTDLIVDARARLLEGLGARTHHGRLALLAVDTVLVAEEVTPSLVAVLPPFVVGVLASAGDDAGAGTGFTSHAAILARGRGLPLAFVPSHVLSQIDHGELIVFDTTSSPANVWPSPSEALVDDARKRRAARNAAMVAEASTGAAPLTHLGVQVRANVSSLAEPIPPGAEGVGLLRTELLYAGRAMAPSEAEQHAAALAVLSRAAGQPVIARLYDAGGDKPLPFLPAPDGQDARGMELLFLHPEVLAAQVRALGRAGAKVLLPLVRSAGDVEAVRALAPEGTEIGAMIETPEAVACTGEIARAADFVCIGTNDLSAAVLGQTRETSALSRDPRVFALVADVVREAHAAGRRVTVCGEIAGDPAGALVLVGLGVDALSVAPPRVAGVRRALAAATKDDCARAAQAAMQGT